MSSPLYRPEVIEAKKNTWMGAVQITTPAFSLPFTLLITACFLGLLGLAFFGSYTRKERVIGRVVPITGFTTVHALADSVVTRMYKHEGDTVLTGDPVIELQSKTYSNFVGDELNQFVDDEYKKQEKNLRSSLKSMATLNSQRKEIIASQIQTIERQLGTADKVIANRQAQSDKANSLLARVRPLQEQQIISEVQIQGYENQALEAESQVQSARQERFDLQRQLADLNAELSSLAQETSSSRADMERELSNIKLENTEKQVQNSAVMAATMNGVVTGMLINPGQTVRKDDPLFTIIPANQELQIELWAPSAAIGEINPGSQIRLRYDAFPHQEYGLGSATLVSISKRAFSPEEIKRYSGLTLAEPAYRLTAKMDNTSADTRIKLAPTMTLNADILLEKRKIYRYLTAKN